MKLTRKQELALIDLGIQTLLRGLTNGVAVDTKPTPKPRARKRVAWNKGKTGRKWTTAQRRKFSQTMKAKWEQRKVEK